MVVCDGTLQRNKYLCSGPASRHSPCSPSTLAPTSRRCGSTIMEVCLIGLRPHSDVSPQNASSVGMQPSTHRAKRTREHTLSTSFEDSMGKHSNLSWRFSHMHFMKGKRSKRPCPNVLIFPAQSGLGMLPQPYCARAQTVYLEDGIDNRLDGHPQTLLRRSRVATSCRELPRAEYDKRPIRCSLRVDGGNITQSGPEMSSAPSAGLLSSIAAALWADAG